MWWSDSRARVWVVGILGVAAGAGLYVGGYAAALAMNPAFRAEVSVAHCRVEENDLQQIECVFRVLEKELRAYGVGAAMETFSAAYRGFPSFVVSACHVQAHRVGDLAYYEIYTGAKDLDSIDLPQSTTACGYGFYHGFLEHFIKSNPNPAFVTKTCGYFIDRLGKTMGDIERICYHGSGHGFLLAASANTQKAEWGDVLAFTRKPIELCDQLTEANEVDVEECKEGIFNVLAEWMWLKQYGFTLEKDRLFSNCIGVPKTAQKACYYEMAQKSPGFVNQDPVALRDYVTQIPEPYFRLMAFHVGIAGIVQNVIAKGTAYKDILVSCDALDDEYYNACMRSVIGGLYEHGEPQEEYKRALTVCTEPSVTERSATDLCYEVVSDRLLRFYTPDRVASICKEFPKRYQHHCQNLK